MTSAIGPLRLQSAPVLEPVAFSSPAAPEKVPRSRRRKNSNSTPIQPQPKAMLRSDSEEEERRRRLEAAESLVIIASSSASSASSEKAVEDMDIQTTSGEGEGEEKEEEEARQDDEEACYECPTTSRYLQTTWECHKGRSATAMGPCYFRSFRKIMLHKLSAVRRTWQIACKAVAFTDNVAKTFVACHLGCGTMSRNVLKEHLMRVARQFRDFALLQPDFAEFSIHDQRQLLFGNAPVFLQFVLGRYLAAAESGQTQLDRLLTHICGDGQTDRRYRGLRLSGISVRSLNKATRLLRGGGDTLDTYQSLLDELEVHCARLTDREETLTPLVALACLYRTTFCTHLNNGSLIDDVASDAMLSVRWSNEVFGTLAEEEAASVVHCLERMALLFEENVRWDESDVDGTGFLNVLEEEVSPSYTVEEDRWLHRQFFGFTETFQGVNYGEETVRACLAYNYDVPLDKSFGEKVILTMRERFRRILMDHEEFRDGLSTREQMELYVRNVGNAVSLCIAKLETLETGYEQWRFSIGSLDNALVQTTLKPSLQERAIKKLTLAEVSGGSLDPVILERFRELVVSVSERVADVEDFKIMSMLLLFDGGVSSGNPVVDHVRQRYLRYYMARREALGEGGAVASRRLNVDMANVKSMTAILQMFMEAEAAKASQAAANAGSNCSSREAYE
jgi:hypothetical protein